MVVPGGRSLPPVFAVKSRVTVTTLAFWAHYDAKTAQLSRGVHENKWLIWAPSRGPLDFDDPYRILGHLGPLGCPLGVP